MFKHFINIARGSLMELRTQLDIASKIYKPIDITSLSEIYELIDEIGKMSYKLYLRLNADAVVVTNGDL